MLVNILVWIVFGLIVGAIARLLVPGEDPMGIMGTMALGIVGSFAGGLFTYLLFGGGPGFEPSGFIGALIGAIIVLLLYRRYVGSAGV